MATSPNRSKRRVWVLRLMAVSLSLGMAFGVAEVVVRMIGKTDADGNFFFRGRHIGAVHPQVEWVRGKIAEYRISDETRMIYNPQTGWSPRPDSSSHSEMYRYNSLGIRSAPAEYREKRDPKVWRIALFGDSFTHCDDVPFEETWGYLLERRLEEAGIRAEVINFGVSAYGMDQAYLRWKQIGRRFKPHVVLFGFQGENVNRNVNILRGFYAFNTGIPFSKPRFRLDENGRLTAVNLPTMPIDEVPETMADMASWKNRHYEWFYNPNDFQRRFWHSSRFLSLLADPPKGEKDDNQVFSKPNPTYPPDSEAGRVTQQILTEFREEVQSLDGRFLVVHLPKKSDLQRSLGGKPLVYEALLREVENRFPLLDPYPEMYEVARQGESHLESLFAKGKLHYSKRGNEVIAERIARFLIRVKRSAP